MLSSWSSIRPSASAGTTPAPESRAPLPGALSVLPAAVLAAAVLAAADQSPAD
jgi:hypothetical protein